jgi:predicted PurR-regulated permease PerM
MTIGAVVLWIVLQVTGALVLLAISALLAYVIYPLVHRLQGVLPRALAITVVYLLLLAALSFFVYIVIASVVTEANSLVAYITFLLSPQGQSQLQPILNTLHDFGISETQFAEVSTLLSNQLQNLITGVVPVVNGAFGVFIDVLVVATLNVYFLLDGARAIYWLRRNTPLGQRERITFLIHTVDRTVGGYVRGQLILAAIAGILTGIAFTLFGMHYAILLALVIFVFSFIPIIGGYVSGALCVLLALPQGWITVAEVAVFLFLLQQILIGQILSPRILSNTVGLHPIIAIFAVIAGGELFGLMGIIFSAPVAGIAQSLLVAFWHNWKATHADQFPPEEIAAQQAVAPAKEQSTIEVVVQDQPPPIGVEEA